MNLKEINLKILKAFRFLFLILGIFLILYPYSGITGFVVGIKLQELTPTIILGIVSLIFAFLCHYTMLFHQKHRGAGEKEYAKVYVSKKKLLSKK